jgi:hypothetical protein
VCNENGEADQMQKDIPITLDQIQFYCANLMAYTENNVAFSIFGNELIRSKMMSALAEQGFTANNFPSQTPTEWLAQLFNNGSATSELLTPFLAIPCPPYDVLLASVSVQDQWQYVKPLVRSHFPQLH